MGTLKTQAFLSVCVMVLLMFLHSIECQSLSRVNTTLRLQSLRAQMKANGLAAYIILSTDAHQGEYVSLHDQRRAYISGLTGSSGNAVVSLKEAGLWTDARYFEQAEQQLDSNWALMKGEVNIVQWLTKQLNKDDVVGVDPFIISRGYFSSLKNDLGKEGIKLKEVLPNLVDQIWTNQPPLPNATVYPLSLKFSGKKWQDKVNDVRQEMKTKGATAVILYKLDETAWLFNLRGSDIPYNPVFYSYAVVTKDDVMLYINKSKVTPEVRKHLSVDDCSSLCVKIESYSDILDGIKKAASSSKSSKLWIKKSCSHALTMSSNETNLLLEDNSPVEVPKAIKNEVEIKGMMKANLKDALAICQFVEWIEKEVPKGRKDLTELSASAKLEDFKSKQADYMGASFFSIFGFGPNGALMHYQPTKASDRQITADNLLLVDTGSQYRDGTCDTTRTFHFGTPTYEQKVAYTRVLKGVIQLSKAVWSNNTKGRFLDILARQELWAGGLEYLHGTGHGIGMFLNVHEGISNEGPQAIGKYCPSPAEKPILPGMFTSNEPGYYVAGSYGIRLETVVLAVPIKHKSVFPDRYYITFEPANLTPYERKMIIVDLLTKEELEYVNNYHKMAREQIGALMKEQNLMQTYDWLVKRTEPLVASPSSSSNNYANALLMVSCLALFWMR